MNDNEKQIKENFRTVYEDKVYSKEALANDNDNALRPMCFSEYVGQEKIKASLDVFIKAAVKRGDTLDHVLLYGPPGLGKTTLAGIIAKQMNACIRVTSGPAIESAADLAAILTGLKRGDVLFIDEIHRLSRPCEEILYSAMEDFMLDMVLGKGPGARTMRLKLEPFTLIGATTRAGKISGPLRDRFGIVNRLELYAVGELEQIVRRNAKILNASVNQKEFTEIAKRSRGTPRIANRILKRVRDYKQVHGATANIMDAFKLLGIDDLGLDFTDINILQTLVGKFGGGPVGIETLAAASGEDAVTIEDIVEPYLLQIGYLAKTPRGREITELGRRHFK